MSRAYLLLALVGLLVATGYGGYRKGYSSADTKARLAATQAKLDNAEEVAKRLRNAISQAETVAAQDREIMLAGDARVAEVRTVFRTIDREVTRYVHAHAADAVPCLDARGLCLWRAINAGNIEDAACDGVDAGPVSKATATAGVGQGAGPAGGSPALGATVPRVAGGGGDVGRVDAGRPPYWGWR